MPILFDCTLSAPVTEMCWQPHGGCGGGDGGDGCSACGDDAFEAFERFDRFDAVDPSTTNSVHSTIRPFGKDEFDAFDAFGVHAGPESWRPPCDGGDGGEGSCKARLAATPWARANSPKIK